MPVNIKDRPIETVREEVIDQLIMNYSHGQLSYQAFDRRLEQAMASNDNLELAALVEDLELKVDKAYVENKEQGREFNYVAGEAEEVENVVNIFSGSTRSGFWKVAKEINYVSIFSGTDFDFTDAQFTQATVKIKIFSLFSGDTIYVPENINVVSKAFCIFGSIDNNIPCYANNKAPTIIIEGYSIFSSLDIKIKRSIKERFVSFADELKKLFS